MKAHHVLAIAGLFAFPAYLFFLNRGQVAMDSVWGAVAVMLSVFSAGHLLSLSVDLDRLMKWAERRAQRYDRSGTEEGEGPGNDAPGDMKPENEQPEDQ